MWHKCSPPQCLIDHDGVHVINEFGIEMHTIQEHLALLESEWKEIFKGDALAFLVVEYNSRTQ